MAVEKFEDLVAWKKSGELTMEVYKVFKDSKDFAFRDQIRKAAVSIMNNIAEGFERKSNREFIRFLFIAKGSCGEVRSMLYLALKLNYITEEEFQKFYKLSVEISKILSGLIKSLK